MAYDIRHIDVNGVRLGYQVRSEGSSKPPAVFAHGYSGRSTGEDIYGEFLGSLEKHFTIYALDLRGHGASASEIDGWSMSAVADDVAAFVEALGIEKPFYIGHSFGGFTGMFCEVRHPATFSALCLITTASAEGGKDTPPEIGQLWIDHGNDREFLLKTIPPQSVRGGHPTAHIDAVILMDRRVHEVYFKEFVDRVIIDDIRNLQLPVLMINGALDNVVPLFTQHATALAIPNCKEIIFTTEGHLLPLEAPDRVVREIVTFWQYDREAMRSDQLAKAASMTNANA
ncbi:alpha/beta fold hydrolase [Flavisphingomonas formosensis]|uniref:alpha/beta fold hydrolase n=1 Tax=Flavisphingomonas formosensis TaxID=861534 RepID=UPI0012F973AF|nr:alpha/beta hydrolase [Sphingomonas formosensis]